ncbi:MAG: DUF1353 domain-containing protein [Devosia sp.]|uniref:DUF1353 domain-containing protein n=1 Tax=Devosia sp. TaxID=1871048 RepID=UPI001AC15CD6|nr:DUF1353 domain-containing protein [Devosia sp.]MBN9308795.1 DUF1353 domain-containing protein [Devosia sp.]MBN9314252.1 DUF1353 domain-containing protein [Devosia sp.]
MFANAEGGGGQFTAPLLLTPDPKGRGYRTSRSFSYDIGFKGSRLTITVPESFPTDLATVPRALWWLFPPHDPQYAAAAVLHDYLYSWRSPDGEAFDRATADGIFLEAMLILGVPRWKALVMFAAVRVYSETTPIKSPG